MPGDVYETARMRENENESEQPHRKRPRGETKADAHCRGRWEMPWWLGESRDLFLGKELPRRSLAEMERSMGAFLFSYFYFSTPDGRLSCYELFAA